MPMGPGTYGTKRGRPPMKNKMMKNKKKKPVKKMIAGRRRSR